MNTSGTGTVFTIGYWVVLATTIACAAGVIGFNLTATYAFASPGGGNSAATIFLATTMAGLAAVRLRVMPVLAAAAVIVVAGAVLLADNDAHGIPILAGLVTGTGLTLVSPARDAAGR